MPTIQLHPTSVPSFFQLGSVKLREDIAFANAKGERKISLEKQAKKTAEKLQPALQHFLEPDETILLIGNGQAPMSGLERYSFGWMAQYIARVVLVVTEKRLLALRVTSSGTWDNKVRVCKWQDVESVSARGWISKFVRIQLRGGRKLDYWGVSRPFAAVMNLLAPQLVQQSAGSASPVGEMVSVCPECKAKLTDRVYECSACGLVFKNERKMRWLALIPSAAYFYCGQRLLAMLDLIGESYVLLSLLLFLAAAVGAAAEGKHQEVGEYFGLIVVMAVLLTVEVLITIAHGHRFIREFIPTKIHRTPEELAMATMAGRN